MARTMETSIVKLAALPAEEQGQVGQSILEGLLDEGHWTRQFAESQDALSKLSAEARADLDQGRATEIDPDNL